MGYLIVRVKKNDKVVLIVLYKIYRTEYFYDKTSNNTTDSLY